MLWAASLHLVRSHAALQSPQHDDLVDMGEHLAQEYGKGIVSIAFIAGGGARSAWGKGSYPIDPPPPPDAVESMLARAGFENALLDLRTDGPGSEWLHRPKVSCPLGYGCMTARWDRAFDAFVFNRTMVPSSQLPKDTDAGADASSPAH